MRQVSKISLDGSLLKKGPANQGWRSASWISPWLIFFQIYNILPPSFVIYCILQYTVYYPLVICYIANEKTKNIVDLPIEDGDVPVRYVSLPESTSISKWKKNISTYLNHPKNCRPRHSPFAESSWWRRPRDCVWPGEKSDALWLDLCEATGETTGEHPGSVVFQKHFHSIWIRVSKPIVPLLFTSK